MINEKRVSIELFEWEAEVLLAALRDTARARWEERECTSDQGRRMRLGDMHNDCDDVMKCVLEQVHDASGCTATDFGLNRCRMCHGTTDPIIDKEQKGVLV